MTSYPYLHGYYQNGNNYIASYSYLIKAAKNGYPTNTSSTVGGQCYLYPKIKTAFTNYSSPYNKYFVLGIAIHAGTDTFAHSSWVYGVSSITHNTDINGNGISDADDPYYVYQRYSAARMVAFYAINRFFGGSTSHPANDILNAYNYYPQDYSLYNFNAFYNQALTYS